MRIVIRGRQSVLERPHRPHLSRLHLKVRRTSVVMKSSTFFCVCNNKRFESMARVKWTASTSTCLLYMESLSASRRLAIYFHRRPVWQKCTLPTYYFPQLRRYERVGVGDYILHKEPKVDERMMYIYSVGLSDRSARVPPATNTASFTQPVAKFI